ncbi:hypothetical protein OHA84_22940 [Streptomyces sp. NBC_00513]|uniref:hypothetical protein n=1 Tax=unclassified Streptomyces TaxID=2593676 RepID=UPI00225A95B4|nr:hypothetical protein [Streptomyces sp. NBC_00424]MCX5073625.1 hypothetical protein [Streptomyces sp. NBC_00424]WUD43137.1 hypothetical protein OHA84_22940 [Streptomyces sp. NBC_00513]
MIGEPELDGEWRTDRVAETAEPAAEPGAARASGRGPRSRWLWVLGGAVLASAVWGGTLVVQNRSVPAPGIAYRHVDDLCSQAPLKALGTINGTAFDMTWPGKETSPALDWSYCRATGGYTEGRPWYGVEVMVERHKKSDPRPEFEARPGLDPRRTGASDVEEVPGLGERALLRRQPGTDAQLAVLDGGVVFTLRVEWNVDRDLVDEDAVHTAMIEDMRALTTRLRE